MLGRDGFLAVARKGYLRWWAGPALGVVLSPSPAHALPHIDIDLQCASLTHDDAAQVEARIRANLLPKEVADIDVVVSCANDVVSVHARVAQRQEDRAVQLAERVAVDAIVGLVEQAVAPLLVVAADSKGGEPPPVRPPEPAASAPEAQSATAPIPGTAHPREPPEPGGHRSESPAEMRRGWGCAEMALSTWASTPAGGATIGLEETAGALFYALVFGGALALGEKTAFRSREWSAAGEFGWQPAGLYGIRFSGRIGVSVLVIDADKSAFTWSTTTKDVGFFEFTVSRPLWLGRVALVPGIGTRVFSGSRDVYVDGTQASHFSNPTLRGTFGLLFPLGS